MRRTVALLLTLAAATAARAQAPPGDGAATGPRFVIELATDSAGAPRPPVVRADGQLGDQFMGALRNGFPVHFAFRLQLWRDTRFFDRLEREVTWDAVVVLDPLTNTFELLRTGGSVETFQDPAQLGRALSTPFTVDLLPRRTDGEQGWYYLAQLTIESLSISELEEVERWLRGDLGPAITRRGDVGNALSRGARLAMIRLSGLPRRQMEARTATFRY